MAELCQEFRGRGDTDSVIVLVTDDASGCDIDRAAAESFIYARLDAETFHVLHLATPDLENRIDVDRREQVDVLGGR